MDSKQYTYRVMWSAEDNEYVGLCAEFPSLSWLDADQSKAFSGIVDVVAEVVADMISNNEKLPVPLSEKIQWTFCCTCSINGSSKTSLGSSRTWCKHESFSICKISDVSSLRI
jgi:predicted RNase H-like HicB family nuclease